MKTSAWLVLVVGLACSEVAAAAETEALLGRAQQGDASALKLLRMRLSESRDSAAEIERVVEGFRQASVKGDVAAQYEFAYLLEMGLGIPRDYRQAEGWYRKAAEAGHVDAQYRLGRMYHEGAAIGSDRRQGYVWLSIAATNGSVRATRLVKVAEATLAPADLKKAREEAESLLGTLPKDIPAG